MLVLHSTIFSVLLVSALLKVPETFFKYPIIAVKANYRNRKLLPGICNADRSFYKPIECVSKSFITLIALQKAHFVIAHWLQVCSSLSH